MGLRDEVRYVNVDAHPGWLLHDYHREAVETRSGPATWDRPQPLWDRLHPDYRAWLDNLGSERIEILVVARLNEYERANELADGAGFPIERLWAEDHPEAFEPLHGVNPPDPEFRLYRVKPDPTRARPLPAPGRN